MATIPWTLTDLADLTGTTAAVTGGTRGVGAAVASLLARAGARVLVGARSLPDDAGADAALLDLGDLDDVERFAAWVGEHTDRLDLLVNNAGISNQPFALAPSGLESQLAVNHLGHFALTARLLPLLSPAGRVVTVTSALYPMAVIDPDALASADGYHPGAAYVRSKLANVLFARALDTRLRASGSGARSLLAHPGLAATSMHDTYPDAQTTAQVRAALATSGREPEPASTGILYAAVAPDVAADVVLGPDGDLGKPQVVAEAVVGAGLDDDLAERLWAASVRYAGVEPVA